MKLFEVQTNLFTYAYPITKIIVSISVILICILRRKLFHLHEGAINSLVSVICFAFVLLCILILYISIGEIFHTYYNRQKLVSDINDTVQIPVEEIVKIVKRDDIVEFEVLTKRGIVKVGSSAENAYCEAVFWGKTFYIDSKSFDFVESFRDELYSLAENGLLNVLTIDGLQAKQHFQ